ncbi:type II toxin-antitoxin system HicB family antitoxin [Candidatus Gottesmanbacteria bacterium]|nr:type II toxin-antitoxin system HicB family antitoxin [Candidatus Gottesmanbacteria bacterium]
MKTNILKYNVIIKKEGKEYISFVPTLGISDFGKNIEEARRNTKEAIECHIEGLVETGEEIPLSDKQDFIISQIETTFPKLKFAF